MCITELVPIRMFGLYSAIGVVISFIVVCFYMPAMLHFFPLRGIVKQVGAAGWSIPGSRPKWRDVGRVHHPPQRLGRGGLPGR